MLYYPRKPDKNVFKTCDKTTATPPNTAAPVQLTTPPEVNALGTYWSKRLRGTDIEIIAAAKKKEIYLVRFPAINLIAGRVGLKLGAIIE